MRHQQRWLCATLVPIVVVLEVLWCTCNGSSFDNSSTSVATTGADHHSEAQHRENEDCVGAYDAWMQELRLAHMKLRRSRAARDSDLYRRGHDDDVPQELEDVFDLRVVVDRPSTADDDVFFAERVGGGRISRESMLIEQLRARSKLLKAHKQDVHRGRIKAHDEHAQAVTKQWKVPAPKAFWRSLMSAVQQSFTIIFDGVCFMCLVVVPWRMVTEMRTEPHRRRRVPTRAAC